MEFLLVDEAGEGIVIKGRELKDEELAAIEDGMWVVFRFRGNSFEAMSLSVTGETAFDVKWMPVMEKP